MRRITSLCTFLFTIFTSGMVLSQVNGEATIDSGYASTWVVAPGAYATPWTPMISTPSATFASPQLQVGASNATSGNVAGASNSTFTTGVAEQSSGARRSRINLGISTFQGDYGVATLAGIHQAATSPAKVYTNEDIQRMKASQTDAQGK